MAADPNNADAWYSMGLIAWSKWYPAYGPVIDAGLRALETALRINPQYADAMAYMNLPVRERAELRDNADDYKQDIAAADEWVRKALDAKRQQAESRQRPQRIPPVYPALALQARLSGIVRIEAIIGKDGRVVNLKVIGGHPLSIPAALEAVKQWVYQPTLLNGNPVEAATTVEVRFDLP